MENSSSSAPGSSSSSSSSNESSNASKTTATSPTKAAATDDQASAQPARSPHDNPINLNISTTTGGSFAVTVDSAQSVDQLKKSVAKKLRVSKDRICLLHRER